MKLVYICSPLRGKTIREYCSNMDKARRYCKYAMQRDPEIIPIAPHVYFTQFLDDKVDADRYRGIRMGVAILKHCTELWVYGKTISSGMSDEIEQARRQGIPIKYFNAKGLFIRTDSV